MRSKSILVLALVLSLAFVFAPNDILAVQEVWYGIENGNYILRRTFDGESLQAFNASSGVASIAMVGKEVWYGTENPSNALMIRINLDGTLIDYWHTEHYVTSIAVVGKEVWYGTENGGIIRRDFDGAYLSSLSTGGFALTDMTVVGQEVWYGIENGLYITRRTFDGELLTPFSASSGVSSIEMVGQEVWYGTESQANLMIRLNLDGTVIDYWHTEHPVTSIAVVGQEVWYGTEISGIIRTNFDGKYLSSISTGGFALTDMAVIPEPATLLLLGLGAVMVRRKQ